MIMFARQALLVCIVMLMAACGRSDQGLMDTYLKRMTEVAIIIENTRSVEGAESAALHINGLRPDINSLVSRIRSLDLPRQRQLLEAAQPQINQLDRRISTAASNLALMDPKARRIISDALTKLDSL